MTTKIEPCHTCNGPVTIRSRTERMLAGVETSEIRVCVNPNCRYNDPKNRLLTDFV